MQGTLGRPPPSAISLVNDTEYGGWARAGQYNRGTIRGAEHGPTMRGILTSVPSPGPRETCLGRNPARCARPAAGCTSQLLYQGWCRDGQDTAAQHTQDTAQHTLRIYHQDRQTCKGCLTMFRMLLREDAGEGFVDRPYKV